MGEKIQLLFGDWQSVFTKNIANSKDYIQIITPFISEKGAYEIISNIGDQAALKLITRLNDQDFINHASSIDALIMLHQRGCRIRAQNRKLHSKVYLFDSSVGIITSSNLTKSGLTTNFEIGVMISFPDKVQGLKKHFDSVWKALSPDISIEELRSIRTELINHNLYTDGSLKQKKGFKDRGKRLDNGKVKTKTSIQRESLDQVENIKNKWIKFMWRRSFPAPLDYDIVQYSNSFGAVTFPKHPGHPWSIKVGDQIFHTALANTNRGRDWLVFGRGEVAIEHRPTIDELSSDLCKRIPEIGKYPYLIWLCNIELISGQLKLGVSLHNLFKEFGDQTFIWSKIQSENGKPNRHKEGVRYYRSHIKLTDEATEYLNFLLDEKFVEYGMVALKSGNDVWWNEYLDPIEKFEKQ